MSDLPKRVITIMEDFLTTTTSTVTSSICTTTSIRLSENEQKASISDTLRLPRRGGRNNVDDKAGLALPSLKERAIAKTPASETDTTETTSSRKRSPILSSSGSSHTAHGSSKSSHPLPSTELMIATSSISHVSVSENIGTVTETETIMLPSPVVQYVHLGATRTVHVNTCVTGV